MPAGGGSCLQLHDLNQRFVRCWAGAQTESTSISPPPIGGSPGQICHLSHRGEMPRPGRRAVPGRPARSIAARPGGPPSCSGATPATRRRWRLLYAAARPAICRIDRSGGGRIEDNFLADLPTAFIASPGWALAVTGHVCFRQRPREVRQSRSDALRRATTCAGTPTTIDFALRA